MNVTTENTATNMINRKNVIVLITSLIFSCMTVAGICCDTAGDNASIVSLFKEKTLLFLLLLVVSCVAFFFLLRFIYAVIDRSCESCFVETCEKNKISLPLKYWLKVTGIIIFCWLPYLIVFFPGTSAGLDYFWQVIQGCGAIPLSNHHPVFGSLVFGVLYKVGYALGGATGGIFFTGLFQTLLMSAVLGYCIAVLIRLGINRIVVAVMMALLCICPVFPMHAMWGVKDSIFSSIAVMFFFVFFLLIVEKKKKVKITRIEFMPIIVILAFVFSEYRNGTFIIALILMMTLTGINFINLKTESENAFARLLKSSAPLLIFVISVTGWNAILDQMNVFPSNERESVGVPVRQLMISLKERPDSFTRDDMEVLEDVYAERLSEGKTLDEMAHSDDYGNLVSDYMKPPWFKNKKQFKDYMKVWLKVGTRNPDLYLDQFLRGTYAYWWPVYDPQQVVLSTPSENLGDFLREYDFETRPVNTYFYPLQYSLRNYPEITNECLGDYLKKKDRRLYELKDVHYRNTEAVGVLEEILEKCKRIPILSMFFAPGIYTWCCIGCIAYLFARKKEGRFLWPVLLIIAMACLSPVNGYMRYVLATDLFSIILMGICFVPNTLRSTSDKGSEGELP